MSKHSHDSIAQPPAAISAEQDVLGALMLAPDSFPLIADWLEEGDFYRRDHQLIYRAIREQAEKSKPHDVLTLMDWFESHSLNDYVENGAYLVGLSKTQGSAANIVAYAEIVKEKATLRQGIEIGNKLVNACYLPDGRDSAAIVAEATSSLANVRTDTRSVGPVPYRNLLKSWFEEATRRYSDGGSPGLQTCWPEVNAAIRGLRPGQLIVLAARPNMGKSIMAFQLACALGKQHHGVGFSMEMTGDDLVGRDVAATGKIPHQWAESPSADDPDSEWNWARVADAIRELRDVDVLIDTQAQLSSVQVIARARRIHRQKKLRFIVIDHMHEMALPGEQGETIERGQVARDLKALGKELDCPVIVLAQLNRNVGARQDKRPNMTDLRGSGAIEEVADLVLFLHRPDYYDPNDRPGLVELIVGKGRNVKTGTIINLRNRYDQMRLDRWGDEPPPAPITGSNGPYSSPSGGGAWRSFDRLAGSKAKRRGDVDE